jgi:DNA mismatch repair protein MSH2
MSGAFATFFQRLDTCALRFFERKGEGCYYTCHGHDAVYVAEKFYKTRSVIKYLGNESLPSVSLSNKMLGEALRVILTVEKRNVEVWQRAKDNTWQRDKKASPGNLLEVESFMAPDGLAGSSAVLSAVHVQTKGTQVLVGIACLNTTWQTIGVYEFLEERDLKLLESVMMQLGTVECMVKDAEDATSAKVHAVLRRCNVKRTDTSSSSFSTKTAPDDLARILGVERRHPPLMAILSNGAALAAASCLLSTLDLGCPKVAGMYKLADTKLPSCMRYDAAVSAALQLFPLAGESKGVEEGQQSCSLFTLLNECATTAGTRMLRTWIQQPLIDATQIQRRLRVVEQLVGDAEKRQSLQEQLPKLPDIARISLNLVRTRSSLRELLVLYKSMSVLQEILATLVADDQEEGEAEDDTIQTRFVIPLQQKSKELGLFTALVEQAIDVEAALAQTASVFAQGRTVFILPAFHPELQRLRQLLDRMGEKEVRLAAETAKALGVDGAQLRLERTEQHGTHFRLTNKNKNALRQKGQKQFKVISIQRAGALFTSDELKTLNRQRDQLEAEYTAVQGELEEKCLSVAASYSPLFDATAKLLAELDVLCGFAVVAIGSSGAYCRPEFCEDCDGRSQNVSSEHASSGKGVAPMKGGRRTLHLVQARHPCVESRSDKPYIPNDVNMCSETSRFQIITGPNMGGKSTYTALTVLIHCTHCTHTLHSLYSYTALTVLIHCR